jgi:hypothetical protein
MGKHPEISQRYPKEIELDESLLPPGPSFFRMRPASKRQVRQVPLRLMNAADKDSIHLFARHLPSDHLLFLRNDITDPATVDHWVDSIEKGTTVTILAERNLGGLRKPPSESRAMGSPGWRDRNQCRTGVAVAWPRRGALCRDAGVGGPAAAEEADGADDRGAQERAGVV